MTRWLTPLLVVSSALFLTFPAVFRPWRVTAWGQGEADNHLWMHWQALHFGGPFANAPEGTGMPLMDPINSLWFAAGFLVDPAVAWNVAWIGSVVLALLGGLWLGWEVDGERGGWISMAVVGGWPFLGGMGSFGITEAWPVGWLAVFGAALVRFSKAPTRIAWAVAGGAALAAFALGGWYHALFAVIAAPALTLFAGATHDRLADRSWRIGVGAAAAASIVPVLPFFVVFMGTTDVWAARWGQATVTGDPAWWLGPRGGGADLAQLVVPMPLDTPSGITVYLGLATLVLVGFGLSRSSRGEGFLIGGAVTLAVLSLGPRLVVAGVVTGVPLPADFFGLVPGLDGVTHWYRAIGPVGVLLAPLAVRAVTGQRRLFVLVAAALVLAEGRFLTTVPFPAQQYRAPPPAALAGLSGRGAVVLLPFDNGRTEFGTGVPRLYDRWGPWLGRPLAENYEGPDALLVRNRLVAAADAACGVEPQIPRLWRPPEGFRDPESLTPQVVDGAVRSLIGAGVEWIAVVEERAPGDCAGALAAWLGEPAVDEDGIVAFALGATDR